MHAILQKTRQKTGKSHLYAVVKKCILVILRTGWDDHSLLLPALKNPSQELKKYFCSYESLESLEYKTRNGLFF